MLILDLDNTIFETKSINPNLFIQMTNFINEYYSSINEKSIGKQIIDEIWSIPMDIVFEKYNTPERIKQLAYNSLTSMDYQLQINTYDDYHFIKMIKQEKILVTTGYEKLQLAKIKALNITSDFKQIIIDDPSSKKRKYKLGIFKEILLTEKLKPEEIWIIGDGVENELKSGKELGMNTIQRLKSGNEKSIYSDYGITSFQELDKIIK